jgi:hypothetical protein
LIKQKDDRRRRREDWRGKLRIRKKLEGQGEKKEKKTKKKIKSIAYLRRLCIVQKSIALESFDFFTMIWI